MSLVTALLAPLALLLPAAGAVDPQRDNGDSIPIPSLSAEVPPSRLKLPADSPLSAIDPADAAIFQTIAQGFQVEAQNQVRIEQRLTIRITPRASAPQPNMFVELPTRALSPRLVEREFGNCLSIAGIAGVEVSNTNRLILYMRDHRVLSAGLERACNARDYYSGFYVERNSDGQICVKRDSLLSRSGATCKLSRIKQLVVAGN
ncbi:MAG: hypothetical protein ABIM50_02255 [Novosphingobium sp.]